MKNHKAITLSFCILCLIFTSACFERTIPIDMEALIVRCEDQRDAKPLIDLARKLPTSERLISSRLAIAAGRIGDFELWRIIVAHGATDPVVSDQLATAILFPNHGFPKDELFQIASTLPYTPRLCQALLHLASPEAVAFVLDKKLYPAVVAENLWRAGKEISEEQLQHSYQRFPHQTTYSLSRLRRKEIVKSDDLMSASPFIRCLGAPVSDDPARFLNDSDWRVRVSALRSVDDIGQLKALLTDDNPLVSAEAFAAMARLGEELSRDQIEKLTPMQARFFLGSQKESALVGSIFRKGGEFAKLAGPYMPAETREEILSGDLPLSVKLLFLLRQSPQEAFETARAHFHQNRSAEALQFLLENEKRENLSEIISEARSDAAFNAVLIDNDLIQLATPLRQDLWYREALEKIRHYRGFTLVCEEGDIRCRFEHADAPLTIHNFIELAEKGYFNNSLFHRVVPAFVCQGGDPSGTGSGGPGYAIRCEYNGLQYDDIGVVGMALSGKDTGGSQFFLTHLPTPHLNYNYTIFARITDGESVLNRTGQYHRLKTIQLW